MDFQQPILVVIGDDSEGRKAIKEQDLKKVYFAPKSTFIDSKPPWEPSSSPSSKGASPHQW